MKKIFTYSGIFLSVVLMGIFSSCKTKEIDQPGDLGLNIKVFSPTKVVPGQPMTINGSGFGDVKEIVFPSAVSVTDFEIVSNEMIRVTAPAGISAEGGKLIVRTDKDQVESPLPITIGSTSISGYSKQEGEEVEGGSQLTVFGKDLEFIYAVKLLNADGLPNIITHEDFYRKGTSSVVITIPKTDIYEGSFKGVVYTYDGKSFEMPEFAYKPKQGGGHWEKVKTMFWENTDGTPIPSWGGTFRFGLEGNDGNNECIATFPADQWAIIKDGTVRVAVALTGSSNIRITTGWWSAAYGGTDHNCTDFVQEDEDGNTFIELNIKEEGTLYDLIDQQHLLFTGDQYTLLAIYTEEEVWVPGEEGHWEVESYWKNVDATPVPSWGGTFRFGLEGNDGNNECIHTFPADQWAIIKDGTVRVAVDVNESSNIRITTGWWSAAYGGTDHNCVDFIQEEEDGTKYIELNIKEEGSIYDLIDQQHLLFTGDNYTVLEIYNKVWVEGGGGSQKPTVIWENDGTPIPSWGGTFRFANEQTKTGEEIHAFTMDEWAIIKEGKVRVSVDANEGSNIRITTGWWTGAYGGTDHNCIDMIQEEDDGTKYIELNIKEDGNLYDNIDQQHLLFTGDAYTLLKIYYYQ